MSSRDSSTKPGSDAAEPLAGPVPDLRTLPPNLPVTSIEEFVTFLEELEAVFGPDDRPRPPTIGDRFLL